jgi:N-acetylneuraminic acid mutarotase
MAVTAFLSTSAFGSTDFPQQVQQSLLLQSSSGGKSYLVNVGGLLGETASGHQQIWQYDPRTAQWQVAAELPNPARHSSRQFASGTVVNQHMFIIGGITRTNHQDRLQLVKENFRYSPVNKGVSRLADTPVAVAQAATVTWQDRYIYLVSGRTNDGLVNLVQVFDNFTQKWQQATPLPVATAGHSAVIHQDKLLVCGGVVMQTPQQPWPSSKQCWQGQLDTKQPLQIQWQSFPAMPNASFAGQASIVTWQGQPALLFTAGEGSVSIAADAMTAGQQSNAGYLWLTKDQRWQDVSITGTLRLGSTVVQQNEDLYQLGGVDHAEKSQSSFRKIEFSLLPK